MTVKVLPAAGAWERADMHDYHPWVFGLLAEVDHKAELGHVAQAQLARQALASRAAGPAKVSARRERSYLQHFIGGFNRYRNHLLHTVVTGVARAGHYRPRGARGSSACVADPRLGTSGRSAWRFSSSSAPSERVGARTGRDHRAGRGGEPDPDPAALRAWHPRHAPRIQRRHRYERAEHAVADLAEDEAA